MSPAEVDDDEPVLTASGLGLVVKDFAAALSVMAIVAMGATLVQKVIAHVLDSAQLAEENDPGDGKEELPILRRAHHDY